MSSKKDKPIYMLVPHEVTASTATIWIGVVRHADDQSNIGEKDVKLWYENNGIAVNKQVAKNWASWKTHPYAVKKGLLLQYQRVTIDSLKPQTSYALCLHVNSNHIKDCVGTVKTLPDKLPICSEGKFTVLLGSCFYLPNDDEKSGRIRKGLQVIKNVVTLKNVGMVGHTYHKLEAKDKPDIKILCGDQVYLDNPWVETTFHVFPECLSPRIRRFLNKGKDFLTYLPEWIRNFLNKRIIQLGRRPYFLNKYIKTWTQHFPDKNHPRGFRLLLQNGANYFCSDDHEFWNNYPNRGGAGFFNLFTKKQRKEWFRDAKSLYEAFQSDKSFRKFSIDKLSFFIADTRINRNKAAFMKEIDLKEIKKWIEGLNGPGILVIGQPLLAKKDYLSELGLPDYMKQYEELKDYIQKSDYSIVAMTGDFHFGRVAHADLDATKGTKFVEIMSSPMSVVSNLILKKQFGDFEDAPDTFKNTKTEKRYVEDRKSFFAEHWDIFRRKLLMGGTDTKGNHFFTIEFSSIEQTTENCPSVKMVVKYWPILRRAKQKFRTPIEHTFKLK